MNNSSPNNNSNFYNSSPSAYNSQYKPQPQPQSNQFNNGKPCFEKKESEKKRNESKISKCSAIISFAISMILVVLMLCSKFEVGIAMIGAVIAFVLSIIGMINSSKEGMAIAGFLISYAYIGCSIMAHLIDVFFG